MRKLILVLLVMPFAASADLINGTSSSGTTVLDTTNNVEWLDLLVTTGLSPDEALAAYSAAGWRWATSAEVTELYDQFFLANGPDVPDFRPGPDQNVPFSDAQFAAFADLFGLTYSSSPDFIGGWYDDGVLNDRQLGLYWYGNFARGGNIFVIGPDSDYSLEEYGVYLIREVSVPEPGTLALFAIGLAGMGLARGRKKA